MFLPIYISFYMSVVPVLLLLWTISIVAECVRFGGMRTGSHRKMKMVLYLK